MAGTLHLSGNNIVDEDGRTVVFGAGPGGFVGLEDLAHVGAVQGWRRRLAAARSGGLSVQIIILADSMARTGSTRYRNAWIDRLRRRFQGAVPGTIGFIPPTEGVLSQTGDANWPGGDDPWTFTGTIGNSISHGISFHAASIPSNGTASITYFGDKISVFFTRNSTGPTACAVTLDGAAQTAIDANDPTEAAGQSATFGTAGSYGFHTLVLDPNDGALILEGVEPYDGDQPFFTQNSVILLDGSHAGFGAAHFADPATNNWSAMLQGAGAFCGMSVVALGANDETLGSTLQEYEDDLVTIANRIDARVNVADLGHLFVMMPGTEVQTVDAAWKAARRIGLGRASVFDLAQLRPDRQWGGELSGDGIHPNDAGHIWTADALGQVLDPTPISFPPVTPVRQVIDYSTPPTFRSNWTESLGGSGFGTYDASPAAASVSERRHRIWLDEGTYRVTAYFDHFASGNTAAEILLGRWAGATPTLTSCGTVNTSSGTGTVASRLGTTVTTQVAGWVPLVIRQPAVAAAVRFVRAVIDKTA